MFLPKLSEAILYWKVAQVLLSCFFKPHSHSKYRLTHLAHTQPDIPHHGVLRLFDENRCHAINAMLVASDQVFDEVRRFSQRSSNVFSDILRSF